MLGHDIRNATMGISKSCDIGAVQLFDPSGSGSWPSVQAKVVLARAYHSASSWVAPKSTHSSSDMAARQVRNGIAGQEVLDGFPDGIVVVNIQREDGDR